MPPARLFLTLAVFWAALVTVPAAARDIPPAPREFVYDEAGWLDAGAERALIQKLLQFERETSNQILVAVFRSLEDEDLADFSQRVAEAWGVGQKQQNNGILLAIYAADKLVDIEVGYGLEGAVTDLIAAQIIENEVRPAFRAGRFREGIFAAVDALMAASKGEYEGTGRANTDRDQRDSFHFPFWLIFLLFIVLGGGRGRRWWLGPLLFSSMGRRGGGGFGGGGFGGGGSFGGGGGSFGGGGARGGW